MRHNSENAFSATNGSSTARWDQMREASEMAAQSLIEVSKRMDTSREKFAAAAGQLASLRSYRDGASAQNGSGLHSF